MNITRPTSRVSRPPGGKTSFSIAGDPIIDVHSTKTSQQAAAKAEAVEVETPAPAPAVVQKVAVEGKVGILIGGDKAVDALVSSITKALVLDGITGSIVSKVNDVSIIPFAAKKLSEKCDVMIVASIMTESNKDLAVSLQGTLAQMAANGSVPIVPGFVVQDSLLEAKAMLPIMSKNWSEAAYTVLKMQNGLVDFEAAPEEKVETPVKFTPEIEDVAALMKVLRASLKAHGARGIIGLSRKFKVIDDDNSGSVDLKEFTKAIKEHSLDWTAKQIKLVFDFFDQDKSGTISFDEFLVGVRGELNDRRRQLVLQAFEILDADHSGVVELNDIAAKYSADKHPDVIAGKRSKDDVLREFLDTFDTEEKDGKVSPGEFCKYYSNVSSSIDDDDYFELMIRNAWHISGGKGWCENSSCRRVLVGHKDGRQTVEEIKNDLGIGPNDKAKMVERLVAQGIDDIAYIEGNDGVKYTPGEPNPSPPTAASPMKPPRAGDSPPRPATGNRRRAAGGQSSIVIG